MRRQIMSAPVEVFMPQVWGSMTEGEITRWVVAVGARIEKDQPLFEISTDKVDAEIPSPSTGVLSRVFYSEGAVVPVNTVVALINGPLDASAEQQNASTVSTSPQKRFSPYESGFSTSSSAVSKQQPKVNKTLESVVLCAAAFMFPILSGILERWVPVPAYAAYGISALVIMLMVYPALGSGRHGFGRWSLVAVILAACVSLAHFIQSFL
jgi:hypothetical protein